MILKATDHSKTWLLMPPSSMDNTPTQATPGVALNADTHVGWFNTLHQAHTAAHRNRVNLLQGVLSSLGVVCQLAGMALQVQQLLRGAVHLTFNSLQLP